MQYVCPAPMSLARISREPEAICDRESDVFGPRCRLHSMNFGPCQVKERRAIRYAGSSRFLHDKNSVMGWSLQLESRTRLKCVRSHIHDPRRSIPQRLGAVLRRNFAIIDPSKSCLAVFSPRVRRNRIVRLLAAERPVALERLCHVKYNHAVCSRIRRRQTTRSSSGTHTALSAGSSFPYRCCLCFGRCGRFASEICRLL